MLFNMAWRNIHLKTGRAATRGAVGFFIAVALLLASGAALAQSSSESGAVLLVAAPNLVDASYYHTVIIAAPVEGDRHIGLIVNRPMRRTLASLFPDHGPSKAVAEPVFFGGPMSRTAVFALAKGVAANGAGSLKILPDLSLAINVNVVDKLIEEWPNDSRYYVGNVVWQPGELYQEIRRGVWNVMNADPAVVFSKNPEQLWEKLSKMARGTMADASGLAANLPELH
ncbi:MAG: YqgE/AlgH family protein [Betaproteobacteria bacterium]|nr:YqgE/AlgH family protein [Betaproteobacteria bacterium]